jgi:hypothetical protein
MGSSAAKNQKNLMNKQAGTLYGEQQQMIPGLETGWEQVMAPLSPTDVAAIQQGGEGTTAQAFDAASNAAANRAAASNNPVGQEAQQDALAMNKGVAVGQAGLKDQATIDAMNRANKEAGLGGLQGLSGQLGGESTSLYGQGTQSAIEQQKSAFNWGNFLDSLVKGGAQVGAAALAGG